MDIIFLTIAGSFYNAAKNNLHYPAKDVIPSEQSESRDLRIDLT